ncbi:hypothetical protein GGI12_005287, partial [Dipsacomyces acuminosporus]
MKQYSLLVAVLTSKAINRCSYSAKTEEKDGESKDKDSKAASDGKVINILTSDIRRVLNLLDTFIVLLEIPINLCIGIWYLYSLLGVSALIGLVISALQYPLNQYLIKYTITYRRKLAAINDKRIEMITEMFKGIRAIKLFGWQSRFADRVRTKREEQLREGWTLWVIEQSINYIGNLISSLTLISILGVYCGVYGNTLTADL